VTNGGGGDAVAAMAGDARANATLSTMTTMTTMATMTTATSRAVPSVSIVSAWYLSWGRG